MKDLARIWNNLVQDLVLCKILERSCKNLEHFLRSYKVLQDLTRSYQDLSKNFLLGVTVPRIGIDLSYLSILYCLLVCLPLVKCRLTSNTCLLYCLMALIHCKATNTAPSGKHCVCPPMLSVVYLLSSHWCRHRSHSHTTL